MSDRACETCRFWESDDYSRPQGDCRVHSPRIIVSEGTVGTMWPTTQRDQWCGEWQTKPTIEIEERLASARRRVRMEDTEDD